MAPPDTITVPWYGNGISVSIPMLSGLDVAASVIATAADVALFRFKVGEIQTLLACPSAGMILYVATGGLT